jgi:hypothetical protein
MGRRGESAFRCVALTPSARLRYLRWTSTEDHTMPTLARFECNHYEPCRGLTGIGRLGFLLVVLIAVMPGFGAAAKGRSASGKAAVENRCGWFVNPTPANAWLIDRDGEWIIATQGGDQAEGDWPSPISEKQWVSYGNGSYGHGCACMRVLTDRKTMHVKRIVSSAGKPLSQCRRDPKLVEPRD